MPASLVMSTNLTVGQGLGLDRGRPDRGHGLGEHGLGRAAGCSRRARAARATSARHFVTIDDAIEGHLRFSGAGAALRRRSWCRWSRWSGRPS